LSLIDLDETRRPHLRRALVQGAMERHRPAHHDDAGDGRRLALDAGQRATGTGLADGQDDRRDITGRHAGVCNPSHASRRTRLIPRRRARPHDAVVRARGE